MLQTLYGKLRTNAIMYVKLTLARARCKLVCMSCEKKKQFTFIQFQNTIHMSHTGSYIYFKVQHMFWRWP